MVSPTTFPTVLNSPEWQQPEKVYAPLKRFAEKYPTEDPFLKKWVVPEVDLAIGCLCRSLTVPLEDLLAFKGTVYRRLVVLFKSSFVLISLSMQPVIAAMAVCQTLAV